MQITRACKDRKLIAGERRPKMLACGQDAAGHAMLHVMGHTSGHAMLQAMGRATGHGLS